MPDGVRRRPTQQLSSGRVEVARPPLRPLHINNRGEVLRDDRRCGASIRNHVPSGLRIWPFSRPENFPNSRPGRLRRRHYFALLYAAAITATAAAEQHVGVVERVVDGDTVIVRGIGSVRLIGVDTSETVHPAKVIEAFGLESSAFLTRLVLDREVRMEFDVERRDRYRSAPSCASPCSWPMKRPDLQRHVT